MGRGRKSFFFEGESSNDSVSYIPNVFTVQLFAAVSEGQKSVE